MSLSPHFASDPERPQEHGACASSVPVAPLGILVPVREWSWHGLVATRLPVSNAMAMMMSRPLGKSRAAPEAKARAKGGAMTI